MKVLIAPDSFKGTASSVLVAEAMKAGVMAAMPRANCVTLPLADGGEGSLKALEAALGGVWVEGEVPDPLGRSRSAKYLRHGRQAFVELAEASGLGLLSENEQDPLVTTTLGTGVQVVDAISQGAKEIVLCIGGSATNDAGLGIAQALGFRFLDKEGRSLRPIGQDLRRISAIHRPASMPVDLHFKILCDVNNPFTGPKGAVHTYAEQKGANQSVRAELEQGMMHLQALLKDHTGVDLGMVPGAGAAGGVGGGLHALLDAELVSGMAFLSDLLDLPGQIAACDLVLTGEGKIDRQTKYGKLISGLVRHAQAAEKPIIALGGVLALSPQEIRELGLTSAFSIQRRLQSLEEAKAHTEADITATVAQIMELINAYQK